MVEFGIVGLVGIALSIAPGVSLEQLTDRERDVALLVARGLTPAQALKTAGPAAAELLGLAAEIGTLEKGKQADIVAVPGDPLADIRVTERVVFVMKGGEVAKNPAK